MHDVATNKSDRITNAMLMAISLGVIVVHLFTSNGYGYFRDEFYAIACSKHLAWGYVDQPPFSEAVLAIIGNLFGYSHTAIHLLPTLCGGAITFLLGLITLELGGKRFAV